MPPFAIIKEGDINILHETREFSEGANPLVTVFTKCCGNTIKGSRESMTQYANKPSYSKDKHCEPFKECLGLKKLEKTVAPEVKTS